MNRIISVTVQLLQTLCKLKKLVFKELSKNAVKSIAKFIPHTFDLHLLPFAIKTFAVYFL